MQEWKGKNKRKICSVWVALLGSSFLYATTSFLNVACPLWSWKEDNPLTAISACCFQDWDLTIQIWYGVSLVFHTVLPFDCTFLKFWCRYLFVWSVWMVHASWVLWLHAAAEGEGVKVSIIIFLGIVSISSDFLGWTELCSHGFHERLGRVKEKQQTILLGPPTWITQRLHSSAPGIKEGWTLYVDEMPYNT
jgi:hypothetical protein